MPQSVTMALNGSVGSGLASGSGFGILARRPSAPKLEPLKNPNLPPVSLTKIFKSLHIGFSDLSYSTKIGILRRENRHILRAVSGNFAAGDLTAIMGPSGAGKSSLMDILAGYTTNGVSGSVTINGFERDPRRYRRQSCYIMQDDKLQPLLTVQEAMSFAANLKLGSEMSHGEKCVRIKQILLAIGLYESRKTKTGMLSGGQRKRLAIALELVNNPPIMFFDEPTSGLDSSTSMQCISLLKKLAQEGRTIVCTIHQPSALLFETFDHLFVVADGECIYQGCTKGVVPFLGEIDLHCPPYHNPSDYLLEISTNDFGNHNPLLVSKIRNGKNEDWRKRQKDLAQCLALARVEEMMSNGLVTPVRAPQISIPTPIDNHTIEIKPNKRKYYGQTLNFDPFKCCRKDDYPTPFPRQLYLLVRRALLMLSRDKVLFLIRFLIHLAFGALIGILYMGIGNDAAFIFDNFNYVFFSIMFLMFTSYSSMSLAFPHELPIITREHFNRWYSLKAYYIAVTLADIPVQVLCTLVYTLISYFMTSQPLEMFRISLFIGILLLIAFTAQGFGLLIGAVFSVQNGVIFGPMCILPFLIFSGFFVHISDAHPYMRWLFQASFLKHGLEGVIQAIFGYKRAKMDCSSDYCHFVWPDKFMDQIDMQKADYTFSVIILIIMCVTIRTITYYVLLYRLRHKR